MIEIARIAAVECSKCDHVEQFREDGEDAAALLTRVEATLRERGWKLQDGALCPRCSHEA